MLAVCNHVWQCITQPTTVTAFAAASTAPMTTRSPYSPPSALSFSTRSRGMAACMPSSCSLNDTPNWPDLLRSSTSRWLKDGRTAAERAVGLWVHSGPEGLPCCCACEGCSSPLSDELRPPECLAAADGHRQATCRGGGWPELVVV